MAFGAFDDPSRSRGRVSWNSRFARAESVDHGMIPTSMIDCGQNSFLLERNRKFHSRLESLHIAHPYQEFPAGHDGSDRDFHVREPITFYSANLHLAFKKT
jgi:hypothetical protein